MSANKKAPANGASQAGQAPASSKTKNTKSTSRPTLTAIGKAAVEQVVSSGGVDSQAVHLLTQVYTLVQKLTITMDAVVTELRELRDRIDENEQEKLWSAIRKSHLSEVHQEVWQNPLLDWTNKKALDDLVRAHKWIPKSASVDAIRSRLVDTKRTSTTKLRKSLNTKFATFVDTTFGGLAELKKVPSNARSFAAYFEDRLAIHPFASIAEDVLNELAKNKGKTAARLKPSLHLTSFVAQQFLLFVLAIPEVQHNKKRATTKHKIATDIINSGNIALSWKKLFEFAFAFKESAAVNDNVAAVSTTTTRILISSDENEGGSEGAEGNNGGDDDDEDGDKDGDEDGDESDEKAKKGDDEAKESEESDEESESVSKDEAPSSSSPVKVGKKRSRPAKDDEELIESASTKRVVKGSGKTKAADKPKATTRMPVKGKQRKP